AGTSTPVIVPTSTASSTQTTVPTAAASATPVPGMIANFDGSDPRATSLGGSVGTNADASSMINVDPVNPSGLGTGISGSNAGCILGTLQPQNAATGTWTWAEMDVDLQAAGAAMDASAYKGITFEYKASQAATMTIFVQDAVNTGGNRFT